MRKIRLMKLILKNFKGVEELELNLEGKTNALAGTNDAGKTTVADAYRWLLFDKDSQGNSQFQIKPLDTANNEVHHLNSVVEGHFQIQSKNVKEFVLKKDYHEVWRKKKGSTKQEFKGHTTDYYIDEEPMKKKEYEAFIAENFMDEDIFSLITEPLYFNEQLHWKDQREILFDLVDRPEPGEIATQAETYYLAEKLEDKTAEQYRKILKDKMKKLDNKLEKIPARIDEVHKGLSTDGLDYDSSIEKLKTTLKDKQEKLTELQEKKAEKKVNKNADKKEKLLKLKAKKSNKKDDLQQKANNKIDEIRKDINETERGINNLEQTAEFAEKEIENMEKRRADLLDRYHEWQEKEFTEEQTVCPECGQKLPEDTVEEHRQQFNQKKATEMEDILKSGKEVKANIENKKEDIKDAEESIKELNTKLDKLKERIQKGKEFKKKVKEGEHEKLTVFNEEISELEIILEDESEDEEEEDDSKDEMFELKKEIAELEKKIANMDSIEKAKERIEELQEEEKKLVQQYEQYEKEMYDLDKYSRTEIKMIQEDVNNLFDIVEFKLFEEQVNGDIKETCEAIVNGVQYSALNTGSKYKAGLDIIKTLTEYYEVEAPIFIDNRERIAQLPYMESQVVHLVMAPKYKELTQLNIAEEELDGFVEEYAGMTQDKLF